MSAVVQLYKPDHQWHCRIGRSMAVGCMTHQDDMTAYIKAKLEDLNPKCGNRMKSASEYIADEIMDTIERERRINRDDLILAVDNAIAKRERALKAANPIMVLESTSPNADVVAAITAWIDVVESNPDRWLFTPASAQHTHTFTVPTGTVVNADVGKWMNC